MLISKMKMSDIKLAAMMSDSGAAMVRVATFFDMGVNTVKKYINAYKSEKIIITHEDIEKACDGETLKNGHKKLKAMGLTHDTEWLGKWCCNHGINYLKVNTKQYKISDEKITEIRLLLEAGGILADVAKATGVSETTVWKVSSSLKMKRYTRSRMSQNTKDVIELLSEAANPLTTLEMASQLGITNKQARVAIQFIRSRPAEYELGQGYRGVYSTYRITAVSSNRKSDATNNKRKSIRDLIEDGYCNESIAEKFKCKTETVENIRQSIAPREKIRKPEMSAAMAMALGMKIK